jgi:hypothetical protein
VRTSATRLFQQWLPLALFVGALGLSQQLNGRDDEPRQSQQAGTPRDTLAVAPRSKP